MPRRSRSSRSSRSSWADEVQPPLDADALLAAIPADVAARIERLDVFASLDSTNRYLIDARPPSPAALRIALADFQHAGRGRRGRVFSAPPGAALCLSVAFVPEAGSHSLSALPLAVGVATRRAVAASCGVAIGLKWPNDLIWAHRKLGGILVERTAAAGAEGHVVIGIGINVAVPPAALATLADRPGGAVDLAEATSQQPPARSALAAALIAELAALAVQFPAHGFAPYREEFDAADTLLDRAVQVVDDAAVIDAIARGADADGALIIETSDGSRRRVLGGDVSIRPAAAAVGQS